MIHITSTTNKEHEEVNNLHLNDESERTEIWNGTETIIKNTLRISPRSSLDCCFDHHGPSIAVTTQPVWKGVIESYNRGIKSRYITEITAENIPYCKELMKYIEVRHLDGIKGNFAIADRKELQIHEIFQKQKPPSHAIYTNVKGFVEAQQFVFESFWNKAIPVADKIKEIEQGVKLDIIETIKDPLEIQRQYINLVRSATNEIMLIVPTTKALMRHADIGIFQLLRESAANNEKVSIRILTHLLSLSSQILKIDSLFILLFFIQTKSRSGIENNLQDACPSLIF
jgi:hypothetical protein